ncbi:MAG: insulinase family protein [Deltaproteobacteria bacterium]|nr:insulinase family protein [Deltaproteobacteria bacterium]
MKHGHIALAFTLALVSGAACGSGPDARPTTRDAIHLVEMRSESPIVTIRVAFRAGSADDPPGKEGLTSLVFDMHADAGTRRFTYTELVQRLFPMAGGIETYSDRDESVIVARVHRDKLDEFYPLFREVLLEPRMDEADFTRLRQRAQTALTLELRGNDDEELGKEALASLVYEGHPYGRPVIGTERGLTAITLDDVRTHRSIALCRERVLAGIAGSYPDAMAERLRRDLRALPSGCPEPRALPDLTCSDDCADGRCADAAAARRCSGPTVLIVDKPEAESTAISMGFPIEVNRDHADYAPLFLATSYLGQHRQFAGVLFRSMRALRGLNYGDYAYSEAFVQDGWSRFPLPNTSRRQQMFSIWIRPVPTENAHFSVRIAMRELERLATDGMTAAQLETQRTFLTRYLPLYGQTESRRLGYALDDAFYSTSDSYFTRLPASWRELDADRLNRVVRAHLAGRRHIAIAIVTRNAAELADAIASERESPITYAEPKPDEVVAEDRVIQSYRLGIPRERIRVVPVAEMFR